MPSSTTNTRNPPLETSKILKGTHTYHHKQQSASSPGPYIRALDPLQNYSVVVLENYLGEVVRQSQLEAEEEDLHNRAAVADHRTQAAEVDLDRHS